MLMLVIDDMIYNNDVIFHQVDQVNYITTKKLIVLSSRTNKYLDS